MVTTGNSSPAQIRRAAITTLKKYRHADPGQRTALLRSLAESLVSVREHFSRPDGSPDWKGRSHAYRAYVGDIYSEAGLTGDEAVTVQASVRYHVGIVLRETLDEETLAAYDLITRNPRERSHDRRAEKSALVSALKRRDVAGGALLSVSTAFTLLAGLDADELAGLGEREAQVAEETLADIERRVKALRRRLKG